MTTRSLAFVVALSAIAPLPAQSPKAQVPSRGIAARSSEVDHSVVDLTHAIAWHDSLADAQAAAQRSGKPIFWLHMLGDLTGST